MSSLQIKRGEIYLIDLGDTLGSEIKKLRPCVVIQNDIGNLHAPTTIVIPITHRGSRNLPTQLEIRDTMLGVGSGRITGMIMGEQVRTVDRCRIKNKVGELTQNAILQVDQIILASLGIKRAFN